MITFAAQASSRPSQAPHLRQQDVVSRSRKSYLTQLVSSIASALVPLGLHRKSLDSGRCTPWVPGAASEAPRTGNTQRTACLLISPRATLSDTEAFCLHSRYLSTNCR